MKLPCKNSTYLDVLATPPTNYFRPSPKRSLCSSKYNFSVCISYSHANFVMFLPGEEEDPFDHSLKVVRNRVQLWEAFYMKYSKNEVNESVDMDMSNVGVMNKKEDLDVQVPANFTNRVNLIHPSPPEKELIHKFEKELDSKLHELTLKTERAKILLKDFESCNSKFLLELKRLTNYVSREEIFAYMDMVYAPNEEFNDLITRMETDLKDLVINELRALHKGNSVEIKMWNVKVRKEWKLLTMTVSEEDLIVYTVNIVKKAGF